MKIKKNYFPGKRERISLRVPATTYSCPYWVRKTVTGEKPVAERVPVADRSPVPVKTGTVSRRGCRGRSS